MTDGEGRLVAGRYRLRQALGRGGMGVVWLADDELLHREVAIKEIQPRGREIRDTDPEVRRALREARAAAKLSDHPGIITVHDVVTDERGLPWIVMQLLDGRSLGTVLDEEGPIPADRAAWICVQVLAALDFAHGVGVLHRDVKPGNVMLVRDKGGQSDKVILTDFGIAVIDGASVLTATGQLPGAPEYIAPERILGEEARPAADVWSVGIMLYGMVVGRTPFHRADIQSTLGAALTRDPDPDPSVGRLAPVIQGLLRKKPAERMTASAAIARLSEIAGIPAPAPGAKRVAGDVRTWEENPDGVATEASVTMPGTLTSAPPFPPSPRPPRTDVLPDAPTLDPFAPPPSSRSRRGLLIAGGAVAAVAAVVATVVLVDLGQGGGGAGASPSTGPSTTTAGPRVPPKIYRERLGFELSVPSDWRRSSSTEDSPFADVTWEGTTAEGTTVTARVLRDTTVAGTTAREYLGRVMEAKKESPENIGFDPVGDISDSGSSADGEYTYRSAAGSTYYREQVRAIVTDDVYTLTFSMYTTDPGTLRDEWRSVRPLIADIRDSFRLTS